MDMKGLILLVLILSALDQKKCYKDYEAKKETKLNNSKNSNDIKYRKLNKEDDVLNQQKYKVDLKNEDGINKSEIYKEKKCLGKNKNIKYKNQLEENTINAIRKEGMDVKENSYKENQKSIEEEMNDIKKEMEKKFSEEKIKKMKEQINDVREKVEENIDETKIKEMQDKMKNIEKKVKNDSNKKDLSTDYYKVNDENKDILDCKINDEKQYTKQYKTNDKNEHIMLNKLENEKQDIVKGEFNHSKENIIDDKNNFKEEKINGFKEEMKQDYEIKEQVKDLREKLKESMDEKTAKELEKKLNTVKNMVGKNINIEKIVEAIKEAKSINQDNNQYSNKDNRIKDINYVDVTEYEEDDTKLDCNNNLNENITDDEIKNIYMDKKKR